MKKLLIDIIFLIFLICGSLYLGFWYGQDTFEPQVIERTAIKTETRIEYQVVIDEVRVPVEVPVEVIVEKPVLLADWESVEELALFLEEDRTDSHIYLKMGKDGEISLEGMCEDFAIQLRDRAMLKGKHLSIEILTRQEIREHYGIRTPTGVLHAINVAIIGNEYWYVEPQTDEMWLAGYLD